jgi:hypothetical protein
MCCAHDFFWSKTKATPASTQYGVGRVDTEKRLKSGFSGMHSSVHSRLHFQPQMHEWVRPGMVSVQPIGWVYSGDKRLKSGFSGMHSSVHSRLHFQPRMHEWVRPGIVSIQSFSWIRFVEKRLKSGALGCLHLTPSL